MNIGIPDGVRVYNRKETFQIKQIEENIANTFEKWGYEEITLPSFEYYDVHIKGLGKDISQKTFKLVDRTSGETLCLRADFTSQIARYFSSLKQKRLPKRYYYKGNIFRYLPPKAGNLWEIRQIGIELIGSNRLEADAEIIAITSKALKNLGIQNFQIDINNTKLFTAIKNTLSFSEETFKEFMEYIKNREIFNLEKFCQKEGIRGALKEFIINIPKYQGDIDLITTLKEKVSNYSDIVKTLDELIKIYNIISIYGLSDKVVFDLGEPKEFSYYTGIVFEIFVYGFSKPLGQGGRYDNLIGKYNGNYPATGFAFDVLNIWEYMKKEKLLPEKKEKDFFIIDLTENKKEALKIARILREKGYIVARDIVDRDYKESLKFAFEDGFKKVIVIGLDNDIESIYIFTTTQKQKIKIQDFLNKV
ncbi:MAG: ATP phosphoribosyltransferase regulatory subunit [Aquificae bacterium]|nr:ATP phosphoribosyltransferase regulatory subunit [Aquificota bacterium]